MDKIKKYSYPAGMSADIKSNRLGGVMIPALVVLLNLLIIIFPKETISAAKNGLLLWFNNVLPSLLPFVIGTNLLMGLGAVNFIGTLLEPVMSRLFRLPGCSGFCLAVGLTSGYPLGAKVASQLRQNGSLTKNQAQRLVGFANNSGPLFVVGSVGGAMLGNISAGYFMLFIHYLGALSLGILFRFFSPVEKTPPARKLLSRSLHAMEEARRKDGRTLGGLLGGSVAKAMETTFLVGGFIVLFSVITAILELLGFFDILSALLSPFLNFLRVPQNLYKGLLTGIIEVTNGCGTFSGETAGQGIFLASSAIISWGGFCIHAQSASFLAKTDLSTAKYLLSKALHSLFTLAYGIVLYPFFAKKLSHSTETSILFNQGFGWKFAFSGAALGITVLGLLICGGTALALRKINRKSRY